MRDNQPLAYSIAEAARLSGIGRTLIYELIAAGRISAVKAGHRTLIPADSLRAYLASLPPAAEIRMPASLKRRSAARAA